MENVNPGISTLHSSMVGSGLTATIPVSESGSVWQVGRLRAKMARVAGGTERSWPFVDGSICKALLERPGSPFFC